nr:histidine kinase [uncultured Microbacterium sp.]
MTISSTIENPLGDPPPGARQLARGVTATWWYTFTAVAFIELFLVLIWVLQVVASPSQTSSYLIVGVGGIVWWLSTMVLLAAYRHRVEGTHGVPRARILVPLGIAAVFGATAGALTDSWLIGVGPLAQSVVLLNWPKGVRLRIVCLATVVLAGLAFLDGMRGIFGDIPPWVLVFYPILLPAMSVSSLWWWDVLITLDRARASEARLAATQERLRVATDVHDLQGHHLQVIALQLELAERLMVHDPQEALEQLRLARASVDDARQGTRDLATRFRSVPLGHEVANARDLLSAAGLEVEAEIAPDADQAPSAALGPVIRETTTNVLRHGAGHRARLRLVRDGTGWRYEIANDRLADAGEERIGSGLDGVRRRIAEAGGTLDVQREDEDFVVIVTVPDGDPAHAHEGASA